MASVAAINNLGGHAHNPRGNLWFKDDSTYGHKLLMKMGWNKGKGLGKNENGIKENLKVKFRGTNSGLGFKDDAYANVMKTEYESILKNLAAEYSCPRTTNQNKDIDSSNEEPVQKSKVVKSKLRYPKLFFGKDVTKYSEKDMKSIFICSSTPLKSIEGEIKNHVISDKKNSERESPKTFDTFSSSLSISDYFAKKMAEKRSNALNKNLSNTTNHQQASLGDKITNFSTLATNDDLTSKRKQKDSQVDIEKGVAEQLNPIITEIKSEQAENETLFNKKSSKKRKKKCENSIEDTEIKSENEPIVSNISKEDILENSLYGNILHDGKMSTVENTTNQDSRPSKKRKKCQAFEDDPVESAENVFSSEIKSSLSHSKKKKKKSKIYSATIQLPSENPVCENDDTSTGIHEQTNCISLEPVEVGLSNNKLKKKKKSKKIKEKLKSCLKSKHGSYSLKNISFNETVCYRIIDSDTESVLPLACCENLDENTSSCKLTNNDENNSSEDAHSEEEITSVTNNSDDNCSKDQSNISDECTLSDLPSSKSSHYNAWVESQRQAIRMQLYKKMLKSIRNHKILKTTNLLSMKGYGNWGFK